MRVPLSWLKEFVEVPLSAEELAERLTFSGLEVEAIDIVGSDFKGIVVGEVTHITPHPAGKKLYLCKVNDGEKEYQVVCGAKNVSMGIKAPFAPYGTTSPGGESIKQVKIRGKLSQGMLCAEDEIGISNDHSGIMILPPELPAGKLLSEVLGKSEPVFVIEVTPNRPDCLSIIGVAREVAALFRTKVKLPPVNLQEAGTPVEKFTSVRVEDSNGCPHYTARILRNIAVKPGPLLVRKRLIQCGIKPINNVVDITNYVMLECGQPLHAFDHALLDEGRIVVRRAKPGETITTLDNEKCKLTPEMLLIADARKPVAVAGIIGGSSCGIRATTTTALLESAYFKPAVVRKTSKLLNLSTESSYRFERGIDIQLANWASKRAASLIASCSGATVASGIIDIFPSRPKPQKVMCRFERINKLLGLNIAHNQVCDIFKALDFSILAKNQKACTVKIPTFRVDIEGEADLIEEVARIYGLEKIPALPSHSQIAANASDAPYRALIHCKSILVGLGLSEIINYSFLSRDLLDLFNPEDAEKRIILPRPVSAEHSILRNSLIPQMGETLARNHSRQVSEAALFEMGRAFFKDGKGKLCEEERMAIGLMGPAGRADFGKQKPVTGEYLFLSLKGILEKLYLALNGNRNFSAKSMQYPDEIVFEGSQQHIKKPYGFSCHCMEEQYAVSVHIMGKFSGILGLLNGNIRKKWRFTQPVAVLEMRVSSLMPHVLETPIMMPPPLYPSVRRDLALIVDNSVKHEEVVKTIKNISPKELTDIQLFDIFKSKGIGLNRKSMAYALIYRSLDRTLTDEEVNSLHSAIKAGIKNRLKAEIREG